MTECTQDSFEFEAHFSRRVTATFDAGTLATDGGGLLLRQTERRIGLLKRLAGCFTDHPRADQFEHRLDEMVAQRIYGLALGYEDLNDHEQLRHAPLSAVLSGKKKLGPALAGTGTLVELLAIKHGHSHIAGTGEILGLRNEVQRAPFPRGVIECRQGMGLAAAERRAQLEHPVVA